MLNSRLHNFCHITNRALKWLPLHFLPRVGMELVGAYVLSVFQYTLVPICEVIHYVILIHSVIQLWQQCHRSELIPMIGPEQQNWSPSTGKNTHDNNHGNLCEKLCISV